MVLFENKEKIFRSNCCDWFNECKSIFFKESIE